MGFSTLFVASNGANIFSNAWVSQLSVPCMPLIAMAGMTLAANFAEDDTWLLFELTIDHCPDRYPVSDKEVVALIDLFEEGPINKDSS